MKTRRLISVLCLLTSVLCLHAADEKPAVLKLADGREFAEWSVKRQTPTTVFVKYKGGGATIAKILLPEYLLAEYPIDAEGAKAEAEALAAAERAGAARKAALEAKRKMDYETRMKKVARTSGAMAKQIEAIDREAAERQRLEAEKTAARAERAATPPPPERVLAAASNHAIAYFKRRHVSQSGRTLVVDAKVDLDGVREVPGWTGRYEVTGVCVYYYFDRGRRHDHTQHFSADVEGNAITVKVTGFSLRSGPPL